ncbi:MAG: C1 family peptidase, partial [Bdellovibrio sp.]
MRSLIIIALLSLTQVGHAALINVQQLNQKLQKDGGEWHAESNHLTELTTSEAKHRMGLLKDEAVDIQFIMPETKIRESLPASLDWRNKDGQNWVSPILDQANCGSCVAFASIGVLETQYKISSLLPNFNVKFSP